MNRFVLTLPGNRDELVSGWLLVGWLTVQRLSTHTLGPREGRRRRNTHTHGFHSCRFVANSSPLIGLNYYTRRKRKQSSRNTLMTSLESCCVYAVVSVFRFQLCDTWHLVLLFLLCKQKTYATNTGSTAHLSATQFAAQEKDIFCLPAMRLANLINFINASFVQLLKGKGSESGSGIPRGTKLFLDSLFLIPFPVP